MLVILHGLLWHLAFMEVSEEVIAGGGVHPVLTLQSATLSLVAGGQGAN